MSDDRTARAVTWAPKPVEVELSDGRRVRPNDVTLATKLRLDEMLRSLRMAGLMVTVDPGMTVVDLDPGRIRERIALAERGRLRENPLADLPRTLPP